MADVRKNGATKKEVLPTGAVAVTGTRKKSNSVRQQVKQLVEQAAAKQQLRDGFQEWVLDRISELNEVLRALEPTNSPLSKAVGSSSGQIYKDLDTARDMFKEVLTNTRPGLQPYFLLLEADPELRARVTAVQSRTSPS